MRRRRRTPSLAFGFVITGFAVFVVGLWTFVGAFVVVRRLRERSSSSSCSLPFQMASSSEASLSVPFKQGQKRGGRVKFSDAEFRYQLRPNG
jgi:hypothetical protein